MTMAAHFPMLENSGRPKVSDGRVQFSYIDSLGVPVTETKSLLEAEDIVRLVRGRMKRFGSAPPGARESDQSRSERKYIAAQPEKALKQAWQKMDADERMEFEMMLDMSSHHGISDPKWLEQNAKPGPVVVGDDGQPLGEERQPEGNVKLTSEARNKLPTGAFALPRRRYPIEDKSHARNALARVSQYGTPEEKARVRGAVHRRFPDIGKSASAFSRLAKRRK